MSYDRSAIVAARRGGQSAESAGELAKLFAAELRADMAREVLTVNSLAGRIGIKAGTLKGYLDGDSTWPIGVLKELARILGRSSDADLAALGYLETPVWQRVLLQQQQLRVLELVQERTALLLNNDPLSASPGGQLAAALSTSPDALAELVDIRLRKLMRGIVDPRPFGELLIIDLPERNATDDQAVKQLLLSMPILPLAGRASSRFADAIDQCGAMFEEGPDYVARLRRQYGTSEKAALVIVPGLLATRPFDPSALKPAFDHLDGAAVTSLHFGGAADVAALIARQTGWGYASTTKLTQQTFSTGLRPYGGQEDPVGSPSARSYHRNCQELTELLLAPEISGRRRVSSLDEPADALAAIQRLSPPRREAPPVPLIMLRMSTARIRWAANRRAIARPGGGSAGDEGARADYQQLVALQDELTRAVEAVQGQPTLIHELPESAADYENLDKDTTDEDFDTYVVAAGKAIEWLAALDAPEGAPPPK